MDNFVHRHSLRTARVAQIAEQRMDAIVKLLILTPLIVFSLSACMRHSACEDTTISQIASPDGKYEAVVFQRTCGREGLERLYTYAEVREVPRYFWSSPIDPRNLATLRGHRPLSMKWEGLRQLVVITPNLKEIDPERKGLGQDTFWKDVQIHYE